MSRRRQVVHDYTRPLSSASSFSFEDVTEVETPRKQKLHSLLLSLERPSSAVIQDAISCLVQDTSLLRPTVSAIDVEAESLERAVMSKLVVGLYSESLQLLLDQSIELENEVEWWANLEGSRTQVAWYLLQTLPVRFMNFLETIRHVLNANNLPLRPSQLTPSSLRKLFPSSNSLRPSLLVTSLFPHLRHESQVFTFSSAQLLFMPTSGPPQPSSPQTDFFSASIRAILAQIKWSLAWLTLPFDLAQQECGSKRMNSEKARDERAKILGSLAQKRSVLANALEQEGVDIQRRRFYYHLRPFAAGLKSTLNEEPVAPLPKSPGPDDTLLAIIEEISSVSLPQCSSKHQAEMDHLRRPSKWLRRWPKIILLPPLALLALRSLYVSRTTLSQMLMDTRETVKGFLVGWLIQPLKDIFNTVRTGGEDGVIVRREGVTADMDSLERMTLALAQEELGYSQEQLQSLSNQIRTGDHTAVLKIYENDIKRPFRSAITGTLLRSLFIQIQKAKVDIDQALTGIDRLLKSQELTFGLIAVSPSVAIVYLLGGFIRQIWTGGRGRTRYGGKRKRASVLFTIRRIERLLIVDSGNNVVSPLTAGLLLLSVEHLRTYGATCLPPQSQLKEAFLQDVGDLEDPELGRTEKMKVVERMWRSYAHVLGWQNFGEL